MTRSDDTSKTVEVSEADRSKANFEGTIQKAIEISAKWRDDLSTMRDAFLREDTDEAIKLAKKLCNVTDRDIEEHRRKLAKEKKQTSKAKKTKG